MNIVRKICKVVLKVFASFGIAMTALLVYFIVCEKHIEITPIMAFMIGFLSAKVEQFLYWVANLRDAGTGNGRPMRLLVKQDGTPWTGGVEQ